jgi:UDP-N-acetylmuramoyl-L-alanine---L-glutamate ligase
MNELIIFLQHKFQGKKILILGFGREGKSTYTLLRKAFPKQELAVLDEQEVDINRLDDPYLSLESEGLKGLSKYDLIFKSPGVSARKPELQDFIKSGKILTSQLNEFLAVYRDQVIGVTGTKGKSTTSALIHHILNSVGKKALLAGNIGVPVFDVIDQIQKDQQIVVEMSSYQLEAVEYSPHIAVWLNLFPEHLNYHGDMDQYQKAKMVITLWQKAKDFIIYNADSPEVVRSISQTQAQKKSFSPIEDGEKLKDDPAVVHLPPVVRKNNVLPAVLVAEVLGIEKEIAFQTLQTFKPLAHRLEEIGTYRGIRFIDDTLATIPEATCEAIEAFPKVDVIMLGGYDRGIDFAKVVDKVVEKKIPVVLFFKPSGKKMYQLMIEKYTQEELPRIYFVEDMKDAVEKAFIEAKPGSIVLLSPASPSFGQFKNYEDKSADFVKWVKELA